MMGESKGGMWFDGRTYEPEHDQRRLGGQIKRVYALLQDGQWRTLDEISIATGDPPASVSARLRDLRKTRFGSHVIDRRPRGERKKGLFEYRLARKNVLPMENRRDTPCFTA